MSLEITLDDHEVAEVRLHLARTLAAAAQLPAPLSLQAADQVLQVFLNQFAGARVYFPSSRAKTPAEVVVSIEAALRQGGRSNRQIAKDLGVSHATVSRIYKRMTEAPALASSLEPQAV